MPEVKRGAASRPRLDDLLSRELDMVDHERQQRLVHLKVAAAEFRGVLIRAQRDFKGDALIQLRDLIGAL